jgi:hypothetical protein
MEDIIKITFVLSGGSIKPVGRFKIIFEYVIIDKIIKIIYPK